MYFKQFLNELVGCASYLVASRQTNEEFIEQASHYVCKE